MAEPPSVAGSTETLLRIVRGVLNQLPDGHEIALDDPLVDLGVTSFQLMQIIAAVEQALDIEFPDSALALTAFESIGSLAAVVEILVRESGFAAR
jgi:acyl carrier protein